MKPIIFALMFCISFFPKGAIAQAKVNIALDRSADAFAKSNASPPQSSIKTDGSEATATSSGGESSQCRPYGRPSFSASSSTISILSSSDNGKILSIFSRSYANGGHYRTCPGGCILGNCVGNHGNDTSAEASGSATAAFRISIDNPPKRYEYEVTANLNVESGSFETFVTTPNGKKVDPIKGTAGYYSISDRTPSLIVRVVGKSSAKDQGGCCSQELISKATVDIKVEPAPQLNTTSKFEPFIAGGRPTSGYPYVASIGFKGLLHCTGTFIGQRTIITAAHCVYGYESKILTDQFDVRFGNNFFMPTAKYSIISYEYPKTPGNPFYFNPKTFEDDIAVIVLDADPSVKAAKIVESSDIWENIISKKRLVNIVGFGFNVIDGGQVGLGVKREASIPIDSIENRKVRFANKEASTCNGDSGGPMFIEADDGKGLFLAAITSGGNDECTEGVNLRADAYLPWLSTVIK